MLVHVGTIVERILFLKNRKKDFNFIENKRKQKKTKETKKIVIILT